MYVNSIANSPNYQASKIQFKGRKLVAEKEYPDYIEKRYNTDASKGRKWGVGVASWILPGVGQFINGEVGKGFGFIGASLVGAIPLIFSYKKGAYIASGLISLATRIFGVVDAVKNAKTEVVEFVPKKAEKE